MYNSFPNKGMEFLEMPVFSKNKILSVSCNYSLSQRVNLQGAKFLRVPLNLLESWQNI
jgi:hypothetical protein